MKGEPLSDEDERALRLTETAMIELRFGNGDAYLLETNAVLATVDALRQQVAEQQATIERLLWLSDGWVGRKETRDEMRRIATQHDGQALREVRAEAWDAGEKVGRDCGMHAARAAAGISQLGPFFVANPHRQPQANHPATTTTDEEGS